MRGKLWTVEEEEKLIKLCKNSALTYKIIAGELGRSLDAVQHRIRKLRRAGIIDYRNPNIIKNKYKKDLTNVIDLTPPGAYFITSVLCDGHLRNRCVQFGFRRRDCIEFRAIFCHILKITPPLYIYWIEFDEITWEDVGIFKIYSTALAKLLTTTYRIPIGKKSGLVRIPQQLIDSTDSKIHGAVLRAVYENEGGVSLDKRSLCIIIGNTSELFLQDLAKILYSYKIDHNIYSYRLHISALKSVLKFYEMAYSVFDLKLHVTAKKTDLEKLIKRKGKKHPYKRRKRR